MSAESTASVRELETASGDAQARRPDVPWIGSIRWCDALLRSYYGIHEFTDDPACVLRVELSQARVPLTLSDGTRLEAGEPVGALHFWNEHFPAYSASGPSLGWACAVRDRVIHSLHVLCEHVERDADWRDVRAIRTETALPARLGARQIGRVFRRYGFERVPIDRTLTGRLHGLGECFVLWGLARAFNPAALARQPFLRDRHELWITRDTLLRRYGWRDGPSSDDI